MLAEGLKSTVDSLSLEERHEPSCYLTKLELQNDADYWKTIRQRTSSGRALSFETSGVIHTAPMGKVTIPSTILQECIAYSSANPGCARG